MSEIDNIFASKGARTKAPSDLPSKKKKKKRQRKEVLQDTAVHVSSSKKRRLPETIVDTSHDLSGPPKRQKIHKNKKSGSDNTHEDLENFEDSRGASQKRTEEGYFVYKEDELGINDQGGDTALCPFDCDCCF